MPTYEYRCKRCGHRFSLFQRITEEPVKNCPKCRAKHSVARLISGGAGLIFKGSGFYITDYKQKSSRPEPKKPDEPVKGDTKKQVE
ncbi:MAG: FmdB family zinc ribbon protein [bacterium]